MKSDTTKPAYPSMGKVVNFAATYEISTQLEVNTSPKASTDAAFNADEFIFKDSKLHLLE